MSNGSSIIIGGVGAIVALGVFSLAVILYKDPTYPIRDVVVLLIAFVIFCGCLIMFLKRR